MLDDLGTPAAVEGQAPVVENTNVGEVAPPDAASPPPSVPAVEPEPTPVETIPEPTFQLPGQTEQPVNEADWLRQQYAQMAQQYQTVQLQLQEMQYKDLPEDERAAAMQQQEVSQLRQYVEQMQQQQALQQWQNYWAQFLPDPTPIRQEIDPIKMGHHVATSLYQQAKGLQAQLAQKDLEIAALKKSAGLPQSGLQVTTGGQGSPVRVTLKDLMKDPEKLDRLYRRAAMGLLEDSEIPSLT